MEEAAVLITVQMSVCIVSELVPLGLLIFRGTLEQLLASVLFSPFFLPGRGKVWEPQNIRLRIKTQER